MSINIPIISDEELIAKHKRSCGLWGGDKLYVNHHTNYEEIHGKDKTIRVNKNQHDLIHRRFAIKTGINSLTELRFKIRCKDCCPYKIPDII